MTQQILTASDKTESIQLSNCFKSKPKFSRGLKQLAPSVVYNKGRNIVYLGCNANEVESYLQSIGNFYRCQNMTVRKPKHTTGFDREIVIRDMQPETDTYAYGLDSLVNGQIFKHWDKDGWEY